MSSASFTAAQFLTAMLWGRIADSSQFGRKTVLLIGLGGTCNYTHPAPFVVCEIYADANVYLPNRAKYSHVSALALRHRSGRPWCSGLWAA